MEEALLVLKTIAGLLVVPLLVLLNAFFVAAEFSLVAVRWTQVEEMVKAKKRGAQAVKEAVSRLDDAIAATQLGITLASLALGWAGEPAVAHLLQPILQALPFGWQETAAHTISVTLAFLLITFLHVVVGELAPKALALQRPDSLALYIATPLLVFSRIARPAIKIMNGAGNAVVRMLGMEPPRGHHLVHSVEELNLLVQETRRAGVIGADQAEYLTNVFRLSQKKVGDIMVPRAKVACLDIHDSEEKILDAIREGAHTRMPIYDGEVNKIIGILNTKDLFYIFTIKGVIVLVDAIRPAMFFPPSKPVFEALRDFRKTRQHLAVVRDAAGVVLGIVTLEDVLEEIVGEIEDEHDLPHVALKKNSAYLG
jgi:CBS domain containing-hemolysin-like protein